MLPPIRIRSPTRAHAPARRRRAAAASRSATAAWSLPRAASWAASISPRCAPPRSPRSIRACATPTARPSARGRPAARVRGRRSRRRRRPRRRPAHRAHLRSDGPSDLDRFVAGDDALGFLGPCDGTPPRCRARARSRRRAVQHLAPADPGFLCARHPRPSGWSTASGRARPRTWSPGSPGPPGCGGAPLAAGALLDDRRARPGARALAGGAPRPTEPPLSIAYGYQRSVERGRRAARPRRPTPSPAGSRRAAAGASSPSPSTCRRVRATGRRRTRHQIVHAGPSRSPRATTAGSGDGRRRPALGRGRSLRPPR